MLKEIYQMYVDFANDILGCLGMFIIPALLIEAFIAGIFFILILVKHSILGG